MGKPQINALYSIGEAEVQQKLRATAQFWRGRGPAETQDDHAVLGHLDCHAFARSCAGQKVAHEP